MLTDIKLETLTNSDSNIVIGGTSVTDDSSILSTLKTVNFNQLNHVGQNVIIGANNASYSASILQSLTDLKVANLQTIGGAFFLYKNGDRVFDIVMPELTDVGMDNPSANSLTLWGPMRNISIPKLKHIWMSAPQISSDCLGQCDLGLYTQEYCPAED